MTILLPNTTFSCFGCHIEYPQDTEIIKGWCGEKVHNSPAGAPLRSTSSYSPPSKPLYLITSIGLCRWSPVVSAASAIEGYDSKRGLRWLEAAAATGEFKRHLEKLQVLLRINAGLSGSFFYQINWKYSKHNQTLVENHEHKRQSKNTGRRGMEN